MNLTKTIKLILSQHKDGISLSGIVAILCEKAKAASLGEVIRRLTEKYDKK